MQVQHIINFRRITIIQIYCTTILCLLSVLNGCRSVPITERAQLLLTTSSYENELGISAYAEYKQKYKQSSNAEYNEALARCGRAISQAAEQDDFEWQFVVLETPVQNAFCLPGGKVAVYSGIMDFMNNEAELAFVIGHEVAHAIARHGGERMSWTQLRSLGGILLSSTLQNETLDGIYGTGTDLGVMLPFSRSNESEADMIGLILMAKAGYNPKASVQFWRRFSQNSQAGMLGSLRSTHPCDADRIQAMEDNLFIAEEEYGKAQNKKGFGVTFTRAE